MQILNWKPAGARRVGRPRKRWQEDLAHFIENKVDDEKARRKLRNLFQHCGQECKDELQVKKLKRWMIFWIKYEDEFVKVG